MSKNVATVRMRRELTGHETFFNIQLGAVRALPMVDGVPVGARRLRSCELVAGVVGQQRGNPLTETACRPRSAILKNLGGQLRPSYMQELHNLMQKLGEGIEKIPVFGSKKPIKYER